jgi:hypothetical protein
MEKNKIEEIELAKDEYREVCNNIRHYSNLRFINFSGYFALMVGLMAVSFGIEIAQNSPDLLKLAARISGILVTIIFWAVENGINRYIDHFQHYARNLEDILSFKQWKTLPDSKLWKTNILFNVLFVAMLIFWVYSVIIVLMG